MEAAHVGLTWAAFGPIFSAPQQQMDGYVQRLPKKPDAGGIETVELANLLKNAPLDTTLVVVEENAVSELDRKRKPTNKHSAGRKSRNPKASSKTLKNITPRQRCLQFPDEPFTPMADCIFCRACTDEVSLLLDRVKDHIKSNKHKNGKKRLQEEAESNKAKLQLITDFQTGDLKSSDGSAVLSSVAIQKAEDVKIYRFDLSRYWMGCGLAFNKLDSFSPFLTK
jgi:hypothetical protein